MFRKVIRQKLHGIRADNRHVLIPTGSGRGARFSSGRLRWWCRRGSAEGSNPILDVLRDLDADFEASRNGGSVQGTKYKETSWGIWIRTQHKRVRIKGGKGDEQATKAASYVRELGYLSRSSKCGIVRAPVHLIWRSRVLEVVVGEWIRMCALPVMSFLQM